jgi:hypothetical protein
MNDSRYSPPKAAVADIAPAQEPGMRQRPRQVVLAVWLGAVAYIVAMVLLVVAWDYYARRQSIIRVGLAQVAGIVFWVWLYFKIHGGRNWARITWLMVSVGSVIGGALLILGSTFGGMLEAPTLIVKVGAACRIALNATIFWLLFVTPGREWFRR